MNLNKQLIKKLRSNDIDIGYKGLDMYLFHYKRYKKIEIDNRSFIEELLTNNSSFLKFKTNYATFKLFN